MSDTDDTREVTASPLPALRTDLTPIVTALREANADAFVAVGDRFDDTLRYLTRFAGPDRSYALVVTANDRHVQTATGQRGAAVLCAPALFREQATREFVAGAVSDDTPADGEDGSNAEFHDGVRRAVQTENAGEQPGKRAAAVIDELCADRDDVIPDHDDAIPDREEACADKESDRTVLVPASIPHDAAVFLERAGNELTATTAVDTARERKSTAELARLRRVQRATAAGMQRAETVLAEATARDDATRDDGGDGASVGSKDATHDDDDATHDRGGVESDVPERTQLRWNETALTTERLRREVNSVLAAHGVCDGGNTVIGAGRSAADLHFVGDDPIYRGETVLIDISPRGPDGYYGDMTRTFVVDGDGGWERRAYVAVSAARSAALAELEPGVAAGTVHAEASAELAAYGFDPNATEDESGFTHGTGHGVGVSLHESPSLSSGTTLRPGHVVTVEPGVYDPAVGGVRLEDLAVVTEGGYEILAEYPFGIVPESR